MENYFLPLSQKENFLAGEVYDIAFKIHRLLGPGLLESIYEKCFCHELTIREIPFIQQQYIPILYENMVFEKGLKIDLLLDEALIVELKAQPIYNKIWEAQLLSYLKMTDKRIGYIVNFHSILIRDGMKRMIL